MVLDDYTDEELLYYESEDSGYESDNKVIKNRNNNKLNKMIYIVNKVILNKRIINFIESKKLFFNNINMNSDTDENDEEIKWECYHCNRLLKYNEKYCDCLEKNEKDNIIDYNKILNVKNKLKSILFISYFINRYINYRKCENYDICKNNVISGEDHCKQCIDEQQTVDSDDYIIDKKLKKKYKKILKKREKNIFYKGYLLKYIDKNIYETEFNGMVYKMDVNFLKNKINNYILNNKN